MMRRRMAILAGLVWFAGASSALAQQTVTRANSMTASATIQAIDQTKRTITLENDKGEEDDRYREPGTARFNELKVGQKVRLTYYESMVLQLLKPGQTANPASYEAALEPSQERASCRFRCNPGEDDGDREIGGHGRCRPSR